VRGTSVVLTDETIEEMTERQALAQAHNQAIAQAEAKAQTQAQAQAHTQAQTQAEAQSHSQPHAAPGTTAANPTDSLNNSSDASSQPPTDPTPPPPPPPLSSIDLSTMSPPLPKHSEYGYLIYASPLEKSLKAVKNFSLTSAVLALISSPVMFILGNQALPVAGRLAISATVAMFGVGTTVALSAVTKSYLVRVFARHDPSRALEDPDPETRASKQWILTFQTMNVFGRAVFVQTTHEQVQPLVAKMFNNVRINRWRDPMQTGNDGKDVAEKSEKREYFIHQEMVTDPLLQHVFQHRPRIITAHQPSKLDAVLMDEEELAKHRQEVAEGKADRFLTKEEALKQIKEMEDNMKKQKSN